MANEKAKDQTSTQSEIRADLEAARAASKSASARPRTEEVARAKEETALAEMIRQCENQAGSNEVAPCGRLEATLAQQNQEQQLAPCSRDGRKKRLQMIIGVAVAVLLISGAAGGLAFKVHQQEALERAAILEVQRMEAEEHLRRLQRRFEPVRYEVEVPETSLADATDAATRARLEAELVAAKREKMQAAGGVKSGGGPKAQGTHSACAPGDPLCGFDSDPLPSLQKRHQVAIDRAFKDLMDGTIAFPTSIRMRQGEQTLVKARISPNQFAPSTANMAGTLTTEPIKISKVAEACLLGEPDEFKIRNFTGSSQEPQVNSTCIRQAIVGEYAEWTWGVTPLKSGKAALHLDVTAILTPDEGGEERTLRTENAEIAVGIAPWWIVKQFLAQYWQWILGGSAASVLGAFYKFWQWFANRREHASEPGKDATPRKKNRKKRGR